MEATLPGGRSLDLAALAREICARYRAEYPDEQERYGDAGIAWCVHDNQHIVNWAALDLRDVTDLSQQLAWLARVLEARHFPLDRLVRDVELASQVVRERVPEEAGLADVLAAGAAFLRSRPSFRAER